MANAWVEHVRKFAAKNGLTYAAALSDPKIKEGYVSVGQKMADKIVKKAMKGKKAMPM
jgi:hypothetical protein